MSRIHEAIKKAERECGTSQPEVTVSPESANTETRARGPVYSVSATVPEATVSLGDAGAAAAQYLRFDDLQRLCAHPEWHLDPNVNVFTNPGLSKHGAEQFRTLRSRLYQVRSNQALKTLLITSSVPGEGKTFITSNLAQAIVRQPDRRVLVIDADLRRPRAHIALGAPSSPGLTDYLRGEADAFSVIQQAHERNLFFIPGGNEAANPSELLSNGRLRELIDRVAPVFDWMLLDSPPCLPVADANILATVCDGVLMVVRAGFTASAIAQRGCQELQSRNIVGVVLNAVEKAHSYSSYHYQGYGYGDDRADSEPKELQ